MKEKAKYFSMLTLSTLLIAFGTYFFKFTNNFTFGGITGLAVLVAKTGLISASDFNLVMSMILLLIGLIVLGKKFAAKNSLLQHPSLRGAVRHGAHLAHGPSAHRTADAGTVLRHRASGARLGDPVSISGRPAAARISLP